MASDVLVVEDESLIAMALVDLLEEAGFTVTGPAVDTASALASARHSPPLVALIDMNLRDGRSGPEIARQLAERHGTVPLALTGEGEGGVPTGSAFRGTLGKPFLDQSVIAAVRAAITGMHKDCHDRTVPEAEKP